MQNRRRGTQLILLGIVVVVLVLGIGLFLNSRNGTSNTASGSPTVPEVVAIQTIPQGTIFKSGQDLGTFFVVRQAPPSLVPIGAYTSVAQIQSLANSTGCSPGVAGCAAQITTTQTIYQNGPVASGMFSTLGQFRTTAGPSFTIPYGYVGIALQFDPVNSVTGIINAGDDIDMIASYHAAPIPKLKAQPQTQYVMDDLRVLSVSSGTTSSTQNGLGGTSSSSGSGGGGTLLVLARFQQALVIQHLKDFGWQLSAVLRSAKETDIPHFKTLPVTDRWFWYKQQNPLKIDPGY